MPRQRPFKVVRPLGLSNVWKITGNKQKIQFDWLIAKMWFNQRNVNFKVSVIYVIWKRASESTTLNFQRIKYQVESNFYCRYFFLGSVPWQRLSPVERSLSLRYVLKITENKRKIQIDRLIDSMWFSQRKLGAILSFSAGDNSLPVPFVYVIRLDGFVIWDPTWALSLQPRSWQDNLCCKSHWL